MALMKNLLLHHVNSMFLVERLFAIPIQRHTCKNCWTATCSPSCISSFTVNDNDLRFLNNKISTSFLQKGLNTSWYLCYSSVNYHYNVLLCNHWAFSLNKVSPFKIMLGALARDVTSQEQLR